MFQASYQDAAGSVSLPLLRVRPQHAVELVIQSSAPLWVATHWLGRVTPCAGEDCPACLEMPARTKGYFIALLVDGLRHRPTLVEVSPSSMSQLAGLQEMASEGWEPGIALEASRKRVNSPLRLEPMERRGVVAPMYASEWRIIAALAVIWSLPAPLHEESADSWEARIRGGLIRRLAKAVG